MRYVIVLMAVLCCGFLMAGESMESSVTITKQRSRGGLATESSSTRTVQANGSNGGSARVRRARNKSVSRTVSRSAGSAGSRGSLPAEAPATSTPVPLPE